MKKMICLLGAALLCGLFTGCASTSTFDASDPTANTARAIGTVSQAECLMAAQAAAESAISSPAFSRFVRNYQIEQKDELAVPLMQVGYLRNDTNDPDLQMNLVTDELCTALMNSGKVEVTLATGRDVSQTFNDARKLKLDKNFKRSTVAKKGTLEAPLLSLEGSIIANVVRDGRDTVQVYSFNLKMADIRSGKVIWSYNKPFGTKKTRGIFGD